MILEKHRSLTLVMSNKDILQPSPDNNPSPQSLELIALYEARLRERQPQLSEGEVQEYVEEFCHNPDVTAITFIPKFWENPSGTEYRGDLRGKQPPKLIQ